MSCECWENRGGSGSRLPATQRKFKIGAGKRAWLRPVSRGNRHFTVGGGRLRLIRSTTGSKVPSSACTRRPDEISTDVNSSKSWPEQIPARGGGDGGGRRRRLWERKGGGREREL
ncbi:hypothetical protein F511_37309 [Dorcoceras hygrometricum]|uniref:Uncharacterized protein n=1 Tax=Dorcoceras hygrometricum TaxID=472368 RepID=A0A2Z7BN33_9LAMI|nr:hypothetical protein F511_37309 [Dorcoceras hygrometricum]